MERPYEYAVIKHNNPDFARENAWFENDWRDTKYAMFKKSVHIDGSESLLNVTYSDDIEDLQRRANPLPTWFNHPLGVAKKVSGELIQI